MLRQQAPSRVDFRLARPARDQYAALLPMLERVQGPEHQDTVRLGSHLAEWIREADRSEA